jgi:hypothetical protein
MIAQIRRSAVRAGQKSVNADMKIERNGLLNSEKDLLFLGCRV